WRKREVEGERNSPPKLGGEFRSPRQFEASDPPFCSILDVHPFADGSFMRRFVTSKTEFYAHQESTIRPPGEPVSLTEFAADVRTGLSKSDQKELYSKYLYDDLGSALFDAITFLPEYGLTRADERLLRGHAVDVAAMAGKPSVVVELGSGSSGKARWILAPMVEAGPVTYCPVDISESALGRCERELSLIESLKIVSLQRSYIDGLRDAVGLRTPGTPVLVLFLGSTIGNFEPGAAEDFL